jgi:TPR repeat protein
MAQAEKEHNQPRKNPIIWVSLIVIGVIIFIFTASDRGGVDREELLSKHKPEVVEGAPESEGQVDRDTLAQPGIRARKLIQQIREQGKPYDFDELMAKASSFAVEGSLADAHLIYFFAAREGHVEAMMMMAEMTDPTLFRPENNLLDKANAVQAYKWYRMALDSGFEPAAARLENLKYWAEAEADYGNADARQLLLNFN